MRASNGRLWGVLNNGEIEIRSITKAELEDCLDVLDAFFQNESICIGCEINLPENFEARQELRELCRKTAEDGASLFARNASTGKAVAVSFNKIQYMPENNEPPFFIKFRNENTHSSQAKCLMDFMIEVDSERDVYELYNLNCVLELMFLCTLPEFERKGIARALAKYTIELTRELSQGKGFEDIHPDLRSKRPQAVTAIFSSQFSQKVGKSQGFKVINTVPYTRFSYNGKTFDQRINPMHTDSQHVIYLLKDSN